MEKEKIKFDEAIAAILLLVMTLLAFMNVLSRYMLHISISFTEEITTNMFGLMTFIGAAIAMKRGKHLGLTIITDHLPEKAVRLLTIFSNFIGIGMFTVILIQSSFMVRDEYVSGALSAGMQWPIWIYGCIVPFGSLILIAIFIMEIVKLLKGGSAE